MTYSVVPGAARTSPTWPRSGSRAWWPGPTTPATCPPARSRALLAGMGMTEKQGGSDVRANTTRAEPPGDGHVAAHRAQVVLLGADVRRVPHAGPGAGRAVVLPGAPVAAGRRAQRRVPPPAAEGQAGQPVQRLQRDRARRGRRLAGGRGGAGRPHHHRHGHPHPARLRARRHGTMRQATAQALHHAAHRRAFGKALVDQPLMRNVLADLAVESEAARVTALRLARAFDEAARGDERRRRLPPAGDRGGQVLGVQAPADGGGRGAGVPGRQRLRRGVDHAPAVPGEPAQRHLGGVGQRDLPGRAAGAWPGSPRGSRRSSPSSSRRAGADAPPGRRGARVRAELGDTEGIEARARRVVERMALALQASLLVRHGHPAVADAFCASPPGRRRRAWRSAPCRPTAAPTPIITRATPIPT